MEALKTWLEQKLEGVARNGKYRRSHPRWPLRLGKGSRASLDDGCIEIDSNTVERSIRPITLNRKNALWGVLASLIEACKLNRVEPHAYPADVLAKLTYGWPMSRLDDLLPLAYVKLTAVA